MLDHPLAEQFVNGDEVLTQEQINDGYALNSGVLRMDLDTWRGGALITKTARLTECYGWNTFSRSGDQSLLNTIARATNTFTPIDVRYNFSRWPA